MSSIVSASNSPNTALNRMDTLNNAEFDAALSSQNMPRKVMAPPPPRLTVNPPLDKASSQQFESYISRLHNGRRSVAYALNDHLNLAFNPMNKNQGDVAQDWKNSELYKAIPVDENLDVPVKLEWNSEFQGMTVSPKYVRHLETTHEEAAAYFKAAHDFLSEGKKAIDQDYTALSKKVETAPMRSREMIGIASRYGIEQRKASTSLAFYEEQQNRHQIMAEKLNNMLKSENILSVTGLS